MRKILSCLLVVAMLLSFVPAAAAAESSPSVQIIGSNMDLGNELVQNFMIRTSDIDDPSQYMGLVTHGDETIEVPLRMHSTQYYCISYGVAAMEMADPVSVCVVDADGNVVSNTFTRSIKDYAQLGLSTSEDMKMKCLLVDMLNYGTEAQKYFGYNEENYANADLTEEQKALASDSVEFEDNRESIRNVLGSNLALNDRILLNVFFSGVSPSELDTLSATVEYINFLGRKVTEAATVTSYNTTACKVVVDQIVLADSRCDVTVKLYDAEGSLIGECVDSVESYAARSVGSRGYALNETIMKFADTAYVYLYDRLSEKFAVNDGLNFVHTAEDSTIEKTLGDLFTAVDGAAISSETVTVAVKADGLSVDYAANAEDWTQGTVTFSGVGTATLIITDNNRCVPCTATVTVTEVKDAVKFEAASDLTFEHTTQDGTIEKTVGDLFTAVEGAQIDTANVTVTYEADGVEVEYAIDAEDWTQDIVTFTGVGTVTFTITDDNFCIPTTAVVTITEPESVAKFEAATELAFEHTVQNGTIEKTVGDLFTAVEGAEIDSSSVTVTYETDGVTVDYTPNAADWTQDIVTFTGVGTVTFTITDDNFCIPTTAVVTITEPESVAKFEAATDLAFEHTVQNGTIEKTVGDLFTAVEGAEIDTANVTVTFEADGVSVEYAPNAADWAQGTVTFTGVGTATLTITDDSFCIPTTASVTVSEPEETEKFGLVFQNTDTYIYRVGNQNTVSLGSLFEAVGEKPVGNVSVTVEALNGAVVSGTYTPNASNWKSGTIQFSGTGPVVVTIDDDAYAVEKTLKLEVVNAKNSASATSVTSATGSNVVLLCDTTGTFSVSGGYTLYGNGFTVRLPNTYQSKYSAGFVGMVNLDSGNLDNVRIEGPVYPETYIYRSQAEDSTDSTLANYFYNAVIINSGNCTISNSYISGCRSAVYVKAGNNVVIENTTLSGGSFANLEVQGATSVTLKDLTTIQSERSDSYGKGKTMIGVGVMVWSGTPEFYIEGELEQYNWVNKTQWDSIVPSVYQSAFPAFFTGSDFAKFQHQRDGVTYVNLAFIFACNWDTAKIHDEHTNSIGYEFSNTVSLGDLDGGVLSVANAGTLTDELFVAPTTYTATGHAPVAPVFTFVNKDEEADDPNNAADPYCVYEGGILKIGSTGSSSTLDLSGVSVLKNGVAMDYTVYLNGNEVTGSSVTINAADGTSQRLTFKAVSDDAGYDKDGNAVAGTVEYTWNIPVEVATLSFPAPVWNMDSYTFGTTDPTKCYYVYYKTSTGYAEVVPIFEGIKVDYYDKSGKLVNLDLSGTTVSKTDTNALGSEYVYTHSDGSTLAIKYSSGYKSGVTAYYFTTYNGKQYVYPSDPSANGNVRPGVSDYDFNVKFTYTFTDPNGQKTDTITVNWYNAKASNSSNVSTIKWGTLDTTNGKNGTDCITGDTLITLADGSVKRADAMTGDEQLLVWDHATGAMSAAPVAYIIDHGGVEQEREVTTLTFSDGRTLEMIGEHVFYDATLNKYAAIADDAESYIGHSFLALTGTDAMEEITLVDVQREVRMTTVYEVVSYEHLTCFTGGILSTSAYLDPLLNIFDLDPETWAYSEQSVAEDIETYGLYTYEDFEGLICEEAFELYNAKYLKIAVGKGYIVWEDILEMIEIYFDAGVEPLQ
ncbi:MAG: hypothetical protein J6J43_00170 [Oscillospiraceae bacterium]|nr:hypothetical protein [Oscillospiraceae bacterium]